MRSFTLALALAGTACASAPAPPRIDRARLLQDVQVLAADDMAGRRTGTEGSAKARAYILSRLQATGVRPLPGGWTQSAEFTPRGAPAAKLSAVNVMGYVPGRKAPGRYIVVSAHYDHLGVRDGRIYNGADDNASGVAALLALAEHFARRPPEHSIVFVAFDAEEMGSPGAKAFVERPPVPRTALALNVNLDMVARGDKGELFVAGTHPWPTLRPSLTAVAAGAPVTLRFGHDTPELTGSDNWIGASDHRVFHEAGVPFAYFGVEDHPDYHQPTDDADRIPADFFGRSVQTLVTAVTRLDADLDEITEARPVRASGQAPR